MRFYLLDKITKIEGDNIEGIKCWTLSDEIFNEHFPGFPLVPGALQLESMAQLIGFLIFNNYKIEFPEAEFGFGILSVVHKAKFREMVKPGDQCVIKGTLLNLDKNRASGKAEIFVNNNLCSQAEMSFIVITNENFKIKQTYIDKLEEYYDILTTDTKKN